MIKIVHISRAFFRSRISATLFPYCNLLFAKFYFREWLRFVTEREFYREAKFVMPLMFGNKF